MKKRDSPELAEEKRAVTDIYGSNRIITAQLQGHYRELTGRTREQTLLWERDARVSHDRESEYLSLLSAVTATEREIVALLTEKVSENKQMQQLRSETSERDQVAMLSLYKKLRACATKEAEEDLPRLQALHTKFEDAVEKLELFVQSSMM